VRCPKCGAEFRLEAKHLNVETSFESVCPHCQTRYRNLKPEYSGKIAKCDKCGKRFRVEWLSRRDTDRLGPAPEKEEQEAELLQVFDVGASVRADDDGRDEEPPKPHVQNDVEMNFGTAWAVGDIIMGLYEVTSVLGEGGMGKVYKVHHRSWDMDLAMKVPKIQAVSAAGGVDNFEREAGTWVNLGLHPNIVSCYYVRRMQDLPLVFAEYVEGGSLKDWIKAENDGLPKLYQGSSDQVLERMFDIAVQFAWGLDYAHERGLIHQDVKPANVLMTPAGTAKVTDFGLAIARTQTEESRTTMDEQDRKDADLAIGTPAYFAPEQSIGGTLTNKIDLWSWALSVLEMFMGERTWKSGTIAPEILEEYVNAAPQKSHIPRMPDALVDLLRSCFKPSPGARPQGMREVADTLMGIYEKVIHKTYHRPEPRAGKSMADNLNNIAVSLIDLGRREEAERLWDKALKSQPHHPGSTYSRGLILWRSGRITDENLAKQMDEVLRSHPEGWLNHYLLGLVHLERDDCHEALKVFKRINRQGARIEEVEAAIQNAKDRLPGSRRLLRVFDAHNANVNTLALSRDGLWALSGSDDKTIKLWEVRTGNCIRTFESEGGAVNSVCLSRDKRYALSGSGDYTRSDFSVKLWETASGRCLRVFEGHGANVNTVCFGKDEQLAFSGGDDGVIKIWVIETGDCSQTLRGHKRAVTSICTSHDGRFLLSASADKTIKLWEAKTLRLQTTLEGHEGTVTSISLSRDGRYLLSGSSDNTITMWDLTARKAVRNYTGHSDEVTSVSMSPDGRFAVSGGLDNTVRLWDLDTGRCLRTFMGGLSWVLSVCLSPDGDYALSGGVGGKIKSWKTNCSAGTVPSPLTLSRILTSEAVLTAEMNYENHLEQAQRFLEQEDFPRAVEHIREARAQKGFARGSKAIKAWTDLYTRLPHKSLMGGWEEASLRGHESWIRTVVLSRRGEYALSGGVDGTLKVWDLRDKKVLLTMKEHAGGILNVCLSDDDLYALSGSSDQTLKLWDVNTGSCVRTLEGHEANVNSVFLSQDGLLGFSGSEDRTIRVWDLAAGRCLRTLEGHQCTVNSICLSMDERYLLSGSGDHTLKENVLKFWDLVTGRCLHTLEGHEGAVNAVALSHDCRIAFSGSSDNTLIMWEMSTGERIRVFEGHTQAVNTICLSQDERYVLSGSSDNTIKLWDVNTGSCLRTFEGHTASVSSARLSRDSRHIISGGEDATLKLWILDWELEGRKLADWDEGAMSYLEAFLTTHMPYVGEVPREGDLSDEEISQRLTRQGTSVWTDEDFKGLLYTLGCAGYGWLRPEGIKINLDYLARRWQGPPELEFERKKIEKPLRKRPLKKEEPGLIKRWLQGINRVFSQ